MVEILRTESDCYIRIINKNKKRKEKYVCSVSIQLEEVRCRPSTTNLLFKFISQCSLKAQAYRYTCLVKVSYSCFGDNLQKEIEELRYKLSNVPSTTTYSAEKVKEDYLQKLNFLEDQVNSISLIICIKWNFSWFNSQYFLSFRLRTWKRS